MPNYKYKGVSRRGKVVGGIIEANNDHAANKLLIDRGVDVFFLREKNLKKNPKKRVM